MKLLNQLKDCFKNEDLNKLQNRLVLFNNKICVSIIEPYEEEILVSIDEKQCKFAKVLVGNDKLKFGDIIIFSSLQSLQMTRSARFQTPPRLNARGLCYTSKTRARRGKYTPHSFVSRAQN